MQTYIGSRHEFWTAVTELANHATNANCHSGKPCGCGFTEGRYFPPLPTAVCIIPPIHEMEDLGKRRVFFSVLEKTFKSLHPDYIGSRPCTTKERFVYYGERAIGDIIAAAWIPITQSGHENVALYGNIHATVSNSCPYTVSLGIVCKHFIASIFNSLPQGRVEERIADI